MEENSYNYKDCSKHYMIFMILKYLLIILSFIYNICRVHMNADAYRTQKRVSDLLKLELQMVVSHLI